MLQRIYRLLPAGLVLLVVLVVVRLLRKARRRQYATAEHLADADSRFVDVQGLRVHYKRAGQGEPVLLLLHGSFLSLFSWRAVFAALAEMGTVIAFDRPSFGLTSRPLCTAQGANPYSPEAQADLTVALLDQLGVQRAVLVGNSTGGTIALLAALRHPQRVQALVLADAMVYSGYAVSEFPAWLRPLLHRLPGALLVRGMIGMLQDTLIRSFWHDTSQVRPETLAAYRRAHRMQHWGRALWQLILSSHALGLERQLAALTLPTLVITGAHDRTVPTSESLRLADALPGACLVVIADCGHLPQEEQPEAFVSAVKEFVQRLEK